jgi:phosphoglucomutase
MPVNVPRLVTAYSSDMPDTAVPGQSVSFGILGHRGFAFENSLNEWHVLVINQDILDYHMRHDIGVPLFLGIDTHALFVPAFTSALEVLAANGLEVMIEDKDVYTPTPVISHAIVAYNRGRDTGLADSSSSRCHTILTRRRVQLQSEEKVVRTEIESKGVGFARWHDWTR